MYELRQNNFFGGKETSRSCYRVVPSWTDVLKSAKMCNVFCGLLEQTSFLDIILHAVETAPVVMDPC